MIIVAGTNLKHLNHKSFLWSSDKTLEEREKTVSPRKLPLPLRSEGSELSARFFFLVPL